MSAWVGPETRSTDGESVQVMYCDPVDQVIIRVGSARVYLPPASARDLLAGLAIAVWEADEAGAA
ncbi:hypothetical protein [Nocardia paucivorans]|uniref:hypothetical protein n=1 Tax=Nocardia paucivorans TaxID=114259 RepID=UPI0005924C55|nr:hypothetical protein [Nocardia paucivorans]